MLKPMVNNRSLLSSFNKGYLDEVARDLNLYQTIETDKKWVCVDGIPCRKKTYLVKHSKGVARWGVEMRKGFVKVVEVEHCVKL